MRDPPPLLASRPSSRRYLNPSHKPAWYAARQKTITRAQKRVERRLWPIFGLAFAFDRRIDLDAAFGRSAVDRSALVLEIGCGSGEALCSLAASRPDADFVGVDWFRGGLAAAMQGLDEAGAAANARLVRADAATLLRDGLEARRALDEVLVFFPDPWRGSEGRRIVRPEVVQSLSPLMQDGGRLHLATDVEGYADEARAVLASCCDAEARWEEVACDCCLPRPSTKYERDGIAAGRGVNDVCWRFVRGSVVRGCGD